jgi:hypothetical protein
LPQFQIPDFRYQFHIMFSVKVQHTSHPETPTQIEVSNPDPKFQIVFQRQIHSDPQIQVSISVHVSRCNPLRFSNSGANFRSEHLPGLKIQIPKCRCQFQIMFEHIHPRYPNSGLKIQIAQSRFSPLRCQIPDYHNSGLKFQVPKSQIPNVKFQNSEPQKTRSQFQILLSRVCLSVGREMTTAHPPRSLNSGPNFRTLNLLLFLF